MNVNEGWEILRKEHGKTAKNKSIGVIFTYLTDNPGKEMSVNDLMSITNTAYQTTKTAADRLEELGLIKSKSFQPMLYYWEP